MSLHPRFIGNPLAATTPDDETLTAFVHSFRGPARKKGRAAATKHFATWAPFNPVPAAVVEKALRSIPEDEAGLVLHRLTYALYAASDKLGRADDDSPGWNPWWWANFVASMIILYFDGTRSLWDPWPNPPELYIYRHTHTRSPGEQDLTDFRTTIPRKPRSFRRIAYY